MKNQIQDNNPLPAPVIEYIKLIIRKIGYRRQVRQEVRQELTDHFTDALRDCPDESQRQKRGVELIAAFGDPKILAALIRRGKKRCRPLWKKAIIRGFQAAGLAILLVIAYTAWCFTGRPTISVDYLDRLNQTARPPASDDDNACPLYEKAVSLYVEPNNLIDGLNRRVQMPSPAIWADLSPSQREMIEIWVARNEKAWQEFRSASEKPYYWKKLQYQPDDLEKSLLNSILNPNIGKLRDLARLGIWRSRLALVNGNKASAYNDCLVIARVGSHLQSMRHPLLVVQLVGMNIGRMSYREILYQIKENQMPDPQWANLQQTWSNMYKSNYPHIDSYSERLFFLDIVQHVFTAGGPGGGHILPEKVLRLFKSSDSDFKDRIFSEILPMVVIGSLHANRDDTVAKANEVYDLMETTIKMTPYQRKLSGYKNPIININQIQYRIGRYLLIKFLVPDLVYAGDLYYQSQADHEALLTVLALKRWQAEKGEYPQTLPELIAAGYLKSLPLDPYSAGPLRYQRRGDDFILYSVGADFIDDGGVENPDPSATWGKPPEELSVKEIGGDRVFWPIH